jgi:hypothetical protein
MRAENRFLRTGEAAKYCGLSPRTLEKLRLTGGGPTYTKPVGRRFVRYAIDDLNCWLERGRRASSSDPVPS